MPLPIRVAPLALAALGLLFAQSAPAPAGPDSSTHACRACIEAHEDFLAGDALRGRASGTRDELLAAVYIASELHAYGIAPAAPDGTYIEIAPAPPRRAAAPAKRSAGLGLTGPPSRREHKRDARQRRAGARAHQSAAPARPAPSPRPAPPAVSPSEIFPAQAAGVGPADSSQSAGVASAAPGDQAPAGLPQPSPPLGTTATVVGVLRGTDADAPVLLLSAHLDHLGVHVPPDATPATDVIDNGASDDASGCTAVLELARVLALGPRPRRTVYFAFFGSEETGGAGARYFLAHPPAPLERMFANIEFEMIGWPDTKVPAGDLWLTGWERSNLGPTLAAHGARLVADPHPEQKFFQRSDNIQLAYAGVVAQTVSAYGLQPMYHHPDDDLLHMDFALLTSGIDSMIAPIRWLLQSDFVPQWNPGGRPSRPSSPMMKNAGGG